MEIVLFLLAVVALSFIFTWLFNGSGGSLIPPLLCHAAQNCADTVEAYFPALADSGWQLVSVLALLATGAVVAATTAARRPVNGPTGAASEPRWRQPR